MTLFIVLKVFFSFCVSKCEGYYRFCVEGCYEVTMEKFMRRGAQQDFIFKISIDFGMEI